MSRVDRGDGPDFYNDSDSDPEEDFIDNDRVFVNADGTPHILGDVPTTGRERLRAFVSKVVKLLGINLDALMRERHPEGTCTEWIKSKTPSLRVAGYIALTTMTLAFWEPSSDLWPLIPAFLYAVHTALTAKGRMAADGLLLMSLLGVTLQVLRTTVPSDKELFGVCVAHTGGFHCGDALDELQQAAGGIIANTRAFQGNLLKDDRMEALRRPGPAIEALRRPGPAIEALVPAGVPELTISNFLSAGGHLVDLLYKATQVSALASYMYAYARRGGSLARTVKAKGWFTTFFALTSIKSLMDAMSVTTMSALMGTMAALARNLQVAMRFVVVGMKRGFSPDLYDALRVSVARSRPVFEQVVAAVNASTMANVIMVILFFFMLLYYTLRYVNRR